MLATSGTLAGSPWASLGTPSPERGQARERGRGQKAGRLSRGWGPGRGQTQTGSIPGEADYQRQKLQENQDRDGSDARQDRDRVASCDATLCVEASECVLSRGGGIFALRVSRLASFAPLYHVTDSESGLDFAANFDDLVPNNNDYPFCQYIYTYCSGITTRCMFCILLHFANSSIHRLPAKRHTLQIHDNW